MPISAKAMQLVCLGAFALPNVEFAKQALENTAAVVLAQKEYRVTTLEENSDFIMVYTDCDRVFTTDQDGAIRHIVLKDENGKELVTKNTNDYNSQYGLHAQAVEAFYHYIYGKYTLELMQIIAAISLAVVLSMICFLINKKYNALMAAVFFITFAFSPYITIFAKNLYWLEFLWFIPVLIGLFCAVYTENKVAKGLSCIAMFFAVLVKSLCGYEYLSTILIAAMSFLAIDMVYAFYKKEKEKVWNVFKITVVLSIAALAGFFVAIIIHGFALGDGNIFEGMLKVYETAGAKNLAGGSGAITMPEHYVVALRDPISMMIEGYFNLSANIVYGISGNWFGIISMLPAVFILYDHEIKERTDIKMVTMYLVFLMATLSWLILAEGHSVIHGFLNSVLWYFGFVQICLYMIIDRVIKFLKGKDIPS
ncbi:MAG: hypothetical protein E7483_06275 [Ruminococcaceae bacterium]|nr:hypothetical protein [Oscillospiraceae bacterium]